MRKRKVQMGDSEIENKVESRGREGEREIRYEIISRERERGNGKKGEERGEKR